MTAEVDVETTKQVSTRDRILDASLVLFNDKGPDRVTTAEIARAVKINEGNLYYHFKTKAAILEALFHRLKADAALFMKEAAVSASGEPGVYSQFMRRWFSIVWDYRHMFRDLQRMIAIAPSLLEPSRSLSLAMRVVVEAALRQMTDARRINVPDLEVPQLLANVWIVSTYWPVYLTLQEGVEDLGPEHLDWGLKQVASLFKPYLSDEAKIELETMLGLSFETAALD